MCHGVDGESGNRLNAQFVRYVLPVTDYSRKTYVEFVTDFLIDISFHNESQDFSLTLRYFHQGTGRLPTWRYECVVVSTVVACLFPLSPSTP